MSYRDRLQPEITLTSPSGIVFTGKWVGNARSGAKQLATFKTPGVKGTIAQDLEIEAISYPITFYFDGTDHDLTADNFFTACAEKGRWSIIHPVHGTKSLQLVDFSEDVQPVTMGGVTQITTNWLETTDQTGTVSASQAGSQALAQSSQLEDTAATQFDNVVKQDTAGKIGKLKTAARNVVTSFQDTVGAITSTVAEVQAQADSIIRGITTTLDGAVVDVLSLAGQIQALIALPNLVQTNIETKIAGYQRLADSILGGSPSAGSPENINDIAVRECALSAALGAVAVASVATELTTRQQVVDTLESNAAFFDTVTNGLDAVQSLYAGELLIDSYFSQSESYADAALMSAFAARYLILSSFNLAIEKRVVMTKDSCPVMIAMEQYGGPGDNDENINLFYDTNALEGEECLLLRVGREVVVYV